MDLLVQCRICNRLQVGQDEALQHLHDNRGQGDESVVIQACDLGLLGNGDDGRSLEASWDVTQLQRGVEDVGKHRGQLVRVRGSDS